MLCSVTRPTVLVVLASSLFTWAVPLKSSTKSSTSSIPQLFRPESFGTALLKSSTKSSTSSIPQLFRPESFGTALGKPTVKCTKDGAMGILESPPASNSYAGVQALGFKSVVGTLWEVNDTAAKHVVKAFYENMFEDLEDGGKVPLEQR
ncbi:hypothetical protein BDR05DRAFT_1006359 [Suillus weaverae]|nr:hypothetical protein BDR05DRAFT_1006359 [Suillus weaverae]